MIPRIAGMDCRSSDSDSGFRHRTLTYTRRTGSKVPNWAPRNLQTRRDKNKSFNKPDVDYALLNQTRKNYIEKKNKKKNPRFWPDDWKILTWKIGNLGQMFQVFSSKTACNNELHENWPKLVPIDTKKLQIWSKIRKYLNILHLFFTLLELSLITKSLKPFITT